jgi:squalene-hopene/tetraprenyl-beta-curcumene cyclase
MDADKARVFGRCFVLALVLACAATAGEGGPLPEPQIRKAMERGLAFLAASQRPDGGWEHLGRSDPAITALAAKCFIADARHGAAHPVSRRALTYIALFARPDGGIYVDDLGLRNYYTSVALMALCAADRPKDRPVVERARAFLIKGQWDEQEGYDSSHEWFGGAGYGRHKRPDLSNTQLMLEALRQSGLPPDDPVYAKARVFVSRCQMLSGANDRRFAAGSEDGGFIYTPVGGGESKAGNVIVDGRPRLRTYGSMTYAGFKSLLYAQVDRDDARVRAALDWIRGHYTLSCNPNMPQAQAQEGLYYYYHVFAKALRAWGQARIVDTRGVSHEWRDDLCRALLRRQRSDGSWVNAADRWYEGNPHLVTAYAILALQTALDDAP